MLLPYTKRKLVMSDHMIEKALHDGLIKLNHDISNDQIQPASLDLRIGKVYVFDGDAKESTKSDFSALSFPDMFSYEPTREHATFYPDEKDIPIVIPPNAFFEVYFHENPVIDRTIEARVDLRSSRGRLGLSLINEKLEYDNGHYIALINNNPNPILLYGQSKFAQLFFYSDDADGEAVTENIADIALSIAKESETLDNYILFTLGDFILKYKQFGIIDTNKKYPEDKIMTKYNTDEPFRFDIGDIIIAQLNPKLDLPNNIGIQLLHNVPLRQTSNSGNIWDSAWMMLIESHCVNAGWVDPGYKGNVTGHPLRTKSPIMLSKGAPIALGEVYQYTQDVKRSYGSTVLNSHYQNSKGDISKS